MQKGQIGVKILAEVLFFFLSAVMRATEVVGEKSG